MTHKAICYDDEGGLECSCELRNALCPDCQTEMRYVADGWFGNGLRLRYCLDCGHMQPVTPPHAMD